MAQISMLWILTGFIFSSSPTVCGGKYGRKYSWTSLED